MIAVAQEYQDPLKQRVFNYFKKFPDGNISHFLKNYPRAHQVPNSKFKEVQNDMQKSGAIALVKGGRAFEELKRELEKEADARAAAKYQPPPDYVPSPLPAPGPDDKPEAVPMFAISPEPTQEEPVMPKEIGIRDLTTEQRDSLILALRKNPSLDSSETYKLLGFTVIKAAFASFRWAVNAGKATPSAENNGHPASYRPGGGSGKPPLPATPSFGVAAVLDPRTRLLNPQIVGNDIACDAMTPEELKTVRKYLPTLLSEILGKTMQFRVGLVMEMNEEGNDVPTLQVKRIA